MTKRYDIEITGHSYMTDFSMEEDSMGDWVRYEDYAELVKALKQISRSTLNGEQTLGASVAKGILERVGE